MRSQRILILCAVVMLLCTAAWAGQRATRVRFGYLDDPGSVLPLLAARQGEFRKEGLDVTLVEYASADEGLAALAAGKLDAGSFPVGAVLQAIAENGDLQIIAGGGRPKPGELEDEIDRNASADLGIREVVTVIRSGKNAPIKETAIRLVTSQIRAHQELRQHATRALRSIRHLSALPPPGSYAFDPNPDYYRFAPIWKKLELQRPEMRRDHLAGHVYEEIYCDALDRALDADPQNVELKRLASAAVCTPDCCPKAKKRKTPLSKGAAP